MLANFTKLFSATTTNANTKRTHTSFLHSPATAAFLAVSLLVIVIVILVCPTATGAVIAIMGAAPAFLNALAGFIVTLHP